MIYIPPLQVDAPAVARQIVDTIGAIDGRVTALTCFMSAQGLPEALSAPGVRIPSYAFPEHAAIALAHAADHSAWREKPVGSVPRFSGIRKDEAAAVIAGALERGEGWLLPDEIARLFDCYGVPTALTFRADTPEAAADVATRAGGLEVLNRGSGVRSCRRLWGRRCNRRADA